MSDGDPASKRHPFEEPPPSRQFQDACRCRGCGGWKPCAAMQDREGQHYCPACHKKKD